MATKSFTNTFKITTQYGIKNLLKAIDNPTWDKNEKPINIEKYMADKAFIQKFMKNNMVKP
jgi:hypothetical protein